MATGSAFEEACRAAHEGGFDVMEEAMREYTEVFDALLDFPFQKILKAFVARARWPGWIT